MADLPTFATFVEALADAARAEALRWHASEWQVEDKSGGAVFDPVTRADRAVERVLREMIAARWPEHGIEGEEYGSTAGTAPYSWSLDPIDGTRSFICGLPTWTILIALLKEGQPVLGLIDAPRLDERYVGFDRTGYMVGPAGRVPLGTSGCQTAQAARLSTTDPYLFPGAEREGFERLRKEARLTRFGLDGYAYARLAAGGLDLVVETGLAPHDWRALVPIVRAAGGAISDWQGGNDFAQGRVIAAATPELADDTLRLLKG